MVLGWSGGNYTGLQGSCRNLQALGKGDNSQGSPTWASPFYPPPALGEQQIGCAGLGWAGLGWAADVAYLNNLAGLVWGRRVHVAGAAGSIGSEAVRHGLGNRGRGGCGCREAAQVVVHARYEYAGLVGHRKAASQMIVSCCGFEAHAWYEHAGLKRQQEDADPNTHQLSSLCKVKMRTLTVMAQAISSAPALLHEPLHIHAALRVCVQCCNLT